jgi:hypothetical protein
MEFRRQGIPYVFTSAYSVRYREFRKLPRSCAEFRAIEFDEILLNSVVFWCHKNLHIFNSKGKHNVYRCKFFLSIPAMQSTEATFPYVALQDEKNYLGGGFQIRVDSDNGSRLILVFARKGLKSK